MNIDVTNAGNDIVTIDMTLSEFLTLRNAIRFAVNTTGDPTNKTDVVGTVVRRVGMFEDITVATDALGGMKALSELNKRIERGS